MIVQLSDGSEVHLTDSYSRKAMRAFNVALGVRAGDRNTPIENLNLAAEAAMPFMIEKIKAGEVEKGFSHDWLDALSSTDFEKIVAGISQVRNATTGKDKKIVAEVEKFLSSTLGSESEVPDEYIVYMLCDKFGWTPEYVENMSAHYYSLFLAFMREEAKAGKLRSQRSGLY